MPWRPGSSGSSRRCSGSSSGSPTPAGLPIERPQALEPAHRLRLDSGDAAGRHHQRTGRRGGDDRGGDVVDAQGDRHGRLPGRRGARSRSRWRVTRPATPTTRPPSTPSPRTSSARRSGSAACWRSSVLRPALGRHLPTVVGRYSGDGALVLRRRRGIRRRQRGDPAGRRRGAREPRHRIRSPDPRQDRLPGRARACSAGSSAAGWSAGWPPRARAGACSSGSR